MQRIIGNIVEYIIPYIFNVGIQLFFQLILHHADRMIDFLIQQF